MLARITALLSVYSLPDGKTFGTDASTLLGKVLSRLRVDPKSAGDDVIDNDLILIWSKEKRVISGADILGRLLRGITVRDIQQSLNIV